MRAGLEALRILLYTYEMKDEKPTGRPEVASNFLGISRDYLGTTDGGFCLSCLSIDQVGSWALHDFGQNNFGPVGPGSQE